MSDSRTIMREIGACVGHIVQAVRADIEPSKVVARREQVEERVVETPAGPMVARRIVVEELVQPAPATDQPPAGA